MRWMRRIALGLVVVAAIIVATGWRLLAASRPEANGTIDVTGLTASVTIARDADGVPTITARDRRDLAYGLGFVHGQERFFQMDLERRSAAGELAALVGPAAVALDETNRVHRFRALAKVELAAFPPARRALLDAYTAGVNAGLAHLSVRPWEYLLLGVKPRPWTDADSILTIDAMYLDLNQGGEAARKLNTARMRAVLPRPLVDFLLAPSPRWEAPMEGGPGAPVPMPGARVFDLRGQRLGRSALRRGARAVATTDDDASGIGSNGFAVGGALTGGGAILANDPHLALRVPNIWYRARLRYRNPVDPLQFITLNGVTLPGAPAMVIGTNGHIAWGFTNSEGDWMDLVRVIRDRKDPALYETPHGLRRIVEHDEVIRVKGAPDVHLTVADTIWGPIVANGTDDTSLALDWIAQHPRAVNLNLMKLETTTTVDAALAIAPTMGIPPQNFVVADASGDIGWTIAGNAFPIRRGFDPEVPADWSKPGTGWIGFADPAQVPRIENPADARIWTANNRIVSGDALQLIGHGDYDLGARAQQIRDDLTARDRFDPRAMLDIQLDNRALFLTRWQELLLAVLDSDRHDKRLAQLRTFVAHWQARAAADSVGYTAVRLFRERVRALALAPFAARASARWDDFRWPSSQVGEYAVWTLIHRQPAWLLDPEYRNWNALLLEAARQTATGLASQRGGMAAQTWGQVNAAQIDNPLARALPGWLADWFDMPHQPLPGDSNMPRVLRPGFGASMRIDVAPGKEAEGILEMPSGQSDNPLSPWFGRGQQAWLQGRPTPLLPGPAKYHLTLEPDS